MLNYDDHGYSQVYGQIEEIFRALRKDDIVQPYISDNDVRSSNNANDFGYKLYVSDIRYKKQLASAQPINVYFNFSENLPAGFFNYALVLTNKFVSISSDGQRHFDLI